MLLTFSAYKLPPYIHQFIYNISTNFYNAFHFSINIFLKGKMNDNYISNTAWRPHLTKENRLPKCYKDVEKVVRLVKSCQVNFKTALAKSRHRGSYFKKVYKLTLNVLKYYNYIEKIIDKLEILKKEKFLRKEVAAILIYELLFGNGSLPGESKAVTTIQGYQNDVLNIHEEFQNNNVDLVELNEIYVPRYVRVHTLLTSVSCAIKDLENLGFKQIFYDADLSEEKFLELVKSLEKGNFLVDFHFKDILVFSQAENLIDVDLYKNGHIFLQDKASYIPVHALNPEPGSTVLDACAAPGMKSAHIASKMKNKGILIACERDKSRFETLKETLKYGSVKIARTLCSDFKLIDPYDEAYSKVDYILLDPSCSGSGMISRMDNITDTENSKNKERLFKLAGFQVILLKHALKFPSVKRVVYSTCSVHEEENEYVVQEALNAFGRNFKLVPPMSECFDRGSENYECGEMCLRTVPEKHLTNGFFVATFERIDSHGYKRKNISVKQSRSEKSDEMYLGKGDLNMETSVQEDASCKKSTMFETAENSVNSGVICDVRLKHKKKKKETSNCSLNEQQCNNLHVFDQSAEYQSSNLNVANKVQDNFSQEYEDIQELQCSKKVDDERNTKKQKHKKQKNVENFMPAISVPLHKSPDSSFKANDIVDKTEELFKNDSKAIEEGEIFDDGNLKKKKKKKKRKHSLEEDIHITQETENEKERNSFENKPEKIKDKSCQENKSLDYDKDSSSSSFIVKEHKKHRKHSKSANFAFPELGNLSESQSNFENNSFVKSENLHIYKDEELTEKQCLVDNYSKCKKKKHKKHSNKSSETLVSHDKNSDNISSKTVDKWENKTIPLKPEEIYLSSSNEDHCHVKKKRKKHKKDQVDFEYINTISITGDIDHGQNLLQDDMSIVTPAQNDCVKRKKHKRHLTDDVCFISSVEMEKNIKENESIIRTNPIDSFSSELGFKNCSENRDHNAEITLELDSLSLTKESGITSHSVSKVKKKKKHRKEKL